MTKPTLIQDFSAPSSLGKSFSIFFISPHRRWTIPDLMLLYDTSITKTSAGGFGNVLFCNVARESVMSYCSHTKLLSTVCPTPYKAYFQWIYTKSTTTNYRAHSTISVETCNLCCCNSELRTKYKKNIHYEISLTFLWPYNHYKNNLSDCYFTWIIPMDITQLF